MLHTVMLRRFLPKTVWYSIREEISHGFSFQKGKGFHTSRYFNIGINEVNMVKYKNQGITHYYIDLVINLKMFLYLGEAENREYLRNTPLQGNMISTEHIYAIYNELFKYFPQLNLHESSLDSIEQINDVHLMEKTLVKWKEVNHYAFALQEMDYTYDIPTSYVDTYLGLLNMGHQPKRIKRILHKHDRGKDNLYEMNGSIKINTYDKERELIERFGNEELANSFRVLRVEIGLKRPKLSYTVYAKNQPNISERTLFDFADIDLGYKMINKYMSQRCYHGHYYDYKTAMNMIENDDRIKPAMKLRLKKVIEGVAYYKGVDKFIEHALNEGKKEETIKKHLKRLEELEINPVTISRRNKDAFPLPNGGRWLPSIFTWIDKMYAIEKDNKEHPENVMELMGITDTKWEETDYYDN